MDGAKEKNSYANFSKGMKKGERGGGEEFMC